MSLCKAGSMPIMSQAYFAVFKLEIVLQLKQLQFNLDVHVRVDMLHICDISKLPHFKTLLLIVQLMS